MSARLQAAKETLKTKVGTYLQVFVFCACLVLVGLGAGATLAVFGVIELTQQNLARFGFAFVFALMLAAMAYIAHTQAWRLESVSVVVVGTGFLLWHVSRYFIMPSWSSAGIFGMGFSFALLVISVPLMSKTVLRRLKGRKGEDGH